MGLTLSTSSLVIFLKVSTLKGPEVAQKWVLKHETLVIKSDMRRLVMLAKTKLSKLP